MSWSLVACLKNKILCIRYGLHYTPVICYTNELTYGRSTYCSFKGLAGSKTFFFSLLMDGNLISKVPSLHIKGGMCEYNLTYHEFITLFLYSQVWETKKFCEAQARVRQGSARDGSQGERPQCLNPCLELTLKLVATTHPQVSFTLTNGQTVARWGRWG